MRYVCDAPGDRTWFRLETEPEASRESAEMQHAVEKYFRREREQAVIGFQPPSRVFIEQEIGLKAHLDREMPMFLTLRNGEGKGLVTAMLPPGARDDKSFKIVIVAPGNSDPYPEHGDAIRALGTHLGIELERSRCYPYLRG